MTVILIRETDSDFTQATPIGAPVGEPIAHTKTAKHQETDFGSVGIWECSPGKFKRQVVPAEYSYIISGSGTFTPEGKEAIAFKAGDTLYFGPNTQGEWEVIETVRKSYFILKA